MATPRSAWALALLGVLLTGQAIECQTRSLGTVVLALRTADSMLIAADSRVAQVDKAGRIQHFRDDACKVIEQNHVVFALAGIAGASTKFDPFAIAKAVMRPGRTVKDMSARFQRLAIPALQTEFRRWPTQFDETPEGAPGIHYLFASHENGANVLIWAGLAGIRRPDRTIVVTVNEHGGWPEQHDLILPFVKTTAIMRETKGRVTFHAEAGAMQLAKNLIGIAAADPVDSQFVGGDIDVVVIRATGISWPQRKPRCQSAD